MRSDAESYGRIHPKGKTVQSNRNWQGVRDVFASRLHDLDRPKLPGAELLTRGCNAALEGPTKPDKSPLRWKLKFDRNEADMNMT